MRVCRMRGLSVAVVATLAVAATCGYVAFVLARRMESFEASRSPDLTAKRHADFNSSRDVVESPSHIRLISSGFHSTVASIKRFNFSTPISSVTVTTQAVIQETTPVPASPGVSDVGEAVTVARISESSTVHLPSSTAIPIPMSRFPRVSTSTAAPKLRSTVTMEEWSAAASNDLKKLAESMKPFIEDSREREHVRKSWYYQTPITTDKPRSTSSTSSSTTTSTTTPRPFYYRGPTQRSSSDPIATNRPLYHRSITEASRASVATTTRKTSNQATFTTRAPTSVKTTTNVSARISSTTSSPIVSISTTTSSPAYSSNLQNASSSNSVGRTMVITSTIPTLLTTTTISPLSVDTSTSTTTPSSQSLQTEAEPGSTTTPEPSSTKSPISEISNFSSSTETVSAVQLPEHVVTDFRDYNCITLEEVRLCVGRRQRSCVLVDRHHPIGSRMSVAVSYDSTLSLASESDLARAKRVCSRYKLTTGRGIQ